NSGDAVVVWQSTVISGPQPIRAAARTSGSWSPPILVSKPSRNSFLSSDPVGISQDGTATAVWSEEIGFYSCISSAVLPRGGIWSPPTTISAQQQPLGSAILSVNGPGEAVAAWKNGTTGTSLEAVPFTPAPVPLNTNLTKLKIMQIKK